MTRCSRRWSGLVLAGALALAWRPVVAQVGESALVAQARTQVRLGNLDSADALLGRVIAAPLASDTVLRAEAFVLLAMVRYYQGNDSATTAAFREALALHPMLQVTGMAQMDPALGALSGPRWTPSAELSQGPWKLSIRTSHP